MNEEERGTYLDFLRGRRAEILERLAAACAHSGRRADDVLLLGVSKTVGIDEVALAWEAGYRAFGENRPQELKRKLSACAASPKLADVRFDMIGNLQTNKVNMVIGNASLIHSVSSTHLAEAISKRSVARGIRSRVLLEVNVSGEESKSGFTPDGATTALDALLSLPGIDVRGLMTMAPRDDPDAARRTFSGLRELRDALRGSHGLPLDVLSCGMSDDFESAVEEGSTLVRLGRTVFDPSYAMG